VTGTRPAAAASTTPGQTLVAQAVAAFARYQEGDRAAFDALVEVMTPLLWRTVRGAGLDQVAAEDVVQTVWLTLLRSAATVRDPQSVVGWLLTAARREAWRVSKRSRAETRRSSSIVGVDGDEAATLPDQRQPSPEERVVLDERQRRLWSHVASLPVRCRQLIGVVASADRPDYAHLAVALGMAVGSIGPTRGRCLAKLRDQLARDPHWAGLWEGTPS
jgi:RNA polymerase sigma factor (sigma-70 family)